MFPLYFLIRSIIFLCLSFFNRINLHFLGNVVKVFFNLCRISQVRIFRNRLSKYLYLHGICCSYGITFSFFRFSVYIKNVILLLSVICVLFKIVQRIYLEGTGRVVKRGWHVHHDGNVIKYYYCLGRILYLIRVVVKCTNNFNFVNDFVVFLWRPVRNRYLNRLSVFKRNAVSLISWIWSIDCTLNRNGSERFSERILYHFFLNSYILFCSVVSVIFFNVVYRINCDRYIVWIVYLYS